MMPDYSFQPEAVKKILARRKAGVKRLVVVAPTGAGKTRIIKTLFELELAIQGKPIVYTNRRVLRAQITEVLENHGLRPGVRAAGHRHDLHAPAQVSSIDTERARSLNPFHPWDVHEGTLAVFDEAHSQKASTAQEIMQIHEEQGAFIVGFTATPVGLKDVYHELLDIIPLSDLRRREVIVPCDVFSPSEIDMADIEIGANGDFVEAQALDRFNEVKHVVLGDIIDHYWKLNPLQKPTVVFAPGVPESRWIADELSARGIPTEHIDANTPEDDRVDIFERFKSGETKVVTNYGILGEGWDAPYVECAILCRPTASVSTYLQMVGRILRAAPGKQRATLIDHVGAWWRPGLGSPNQDRKWDLNDTNKSIAKKAKQKLETREAGEKEPARCPQCSRVLGPVRPKHDFKCICGHVFKMSQRRIIQKNGDLSLQKGSVIKRKAPKNDTDYFRSAIFQGVQCKPVLTVGQVYRMACVAKSRATGVENCLISRSECAIDIPERGTPGWDMTCDYQYPWAVEKVKARRPGWTPAKPTEAKV